MIPVFLIIYKSLTYHVNPFLHSSLSSFIRHLQFALNAQLGTLKLNNRAMHIVGFSMDYNLDRELMMQNSGIYTMDGCQ